jgi:Recombination endonuclease VII
MSNIYNIAEYKNCNGCKSKKPLTEFWKSQTLCIICSKERQKTRWNSRSPKKRLEQHLKYKYDLTINELMDQFKKQNENCAICEVTLPDLLVYNNRKRGYAIDHNHKNGQFRGILCLKCNSMLGMSNDNPDVLVKASSYLKERGFYCDYNVAAARSGKGK